MTFDIVQLCDIDIDVIDGDRGKNYPHQDELLGTGYCLFLSAKNVTQNGFLFADNQFITQEKDELLNKGKLKRGDIVITTRGTVGNVAIYSEEVPYDNIRINSGMLIIRCGNGIDSYYLYQVLRSKWFYNQILSIQSGSAQPQLPKSHFLKMVIPIPDMNTQNKIAGILSSVGNKIALNTAINENLEQQAQAIFKSWFVDFEPFGGVMPDYWQETTLGNVTDNIRTKIKNNSTPVFSAVNSGNLVYSDEYFNKQVYSKDISKYIIVDNWNFAYNPARINIGSIGINDLGVIGCVSPVYVVFSVQAEYHSFFRFFFRQEAFKQQSLVRASGSVRQTLNYTDFSLIDIAYPTKEYAQKFDVIWKSYFSVIERLRKENEKLLELRDSLLPKLMNGEIDVSKVRI